MIAEQVGTTLLSFVSYRPIANSKHIDSSMNAMGYSYGEENLVESQQVYHSVNVKDTL